ncbi:E3 ubiquitin-protein ligase TRIP12 [Clonorchis sinensis]|uniref:E3 ubiquitin-protein ligase n=1 Tax=Clonorchis sinensis TaxID=79923 RepID=G7Y8M8_CLOSI|nr:E3 ubiquitin-protein ligase TRIP12 [Clonorchis sinensis]
MAGKRKRSRKSNEITPVSEFTFTTSSDQPSTVSSSATEPSTLTLASAPVSNCGEILSVDLGATASKRRRRDRQRSAVCPNPTEHTQLKPSYSAGGKLLHHRATEVSSLQLDCDGRSRTAVSIKQSTTESSNTTGNGTNTMLSEGAPESNQSVSVTQSACTGLLSHQYATGTPSLYLVPGSVPPTPSGERYISRRNSAHRTTVVTGTEQNLYLIPHGANQLAADGSRSDHRNTQSYHQPSTLPIDLTVPPGSQLRTVTFNNNPSSMSGASPVDQHQPVNIAYLPSADFSAQAALPSDGTGQSSAADLSYTIPHSVLNTAPLHYDGRTVMSLSYQAGKPPPNAILPVFTDTSSAPLLVTPAAVGTTYSVSHHPHEQQSQQKQHQDLLNSINVARFISLNSAPRNPKAAATTDISSFSSPPTNSSHPPTQFSTKLSRHTNAETNLVSGSGRDVVNWSVARGSTSHAGGRHSPHILLMGFEENLINMNVHGLVSCILDILECGEEHLIELKNLGCNVLTHMMDALPRSSEAVVPALPLLLTTMSSSFVGDILERIINLLEQLSRRHGREVLQSGAIMSALGFYDFVTLAQHRTILTMVANCFVNLQRSDFELIIDCLPGLAERLKAPEPRCVEHVCTCFVRLVNTYRSEPELLKRIVTTCDLFTNLQHLLMASPPVLSSVRDVIHMLAIVCSSCPELAVELVKKNISSTLYCILTGEAIDSDTLQSIISSPLDNPSLLAPLTGDQPGSPRRHRSHSGNTRKRTSFSRHSRPEAGDDLGSSATLGPPDIWPPLMLTLSPLSDSLPFTVSVTKRSQEDVHSIVQLIWGFARVTPTDNQPNAIEYRLEPVNSYSGPDLLPDSPLKVQLEAPHRLTIIFHNESLTLDSGPFQAAEVDNEPTDFNQPRSISNRVPMQTNLSRSSPSVWSVQDAADTHGLREKPANATPKRRISRHVPQQAEALLADTGPTTGESQTVEPMPILHRPDQPSPRILELYMVVDEALATEEGQQPIWRRSCDAITRVVEITVHDLSHSATRD